MWKLWKTSRLLAIEELPDRKSAMENRKSIDLGTSNEQIEAILSRISDLIHGPKLLREDGGFLFMVTKGTEKYGKLSRY